MSESSEQNGARARLLAAHRRFISRICPVSDNHPISRFLCIFLTYGLLVFSLAAVVVSSDDIEPTLFGRSFGWYSAVFFLVRTLLYLSLGWLIPTD